MQNPLTLVSLPQCGRITGYEAISYGADLITLASILRISVYMHNVPEKQVFRPAAWTAFGMDLEGSDFRACENFGPMYK